MNFEVSQLSTQYIWQYHNHFILGNNLWNVFNLFLLYIILLTDNNQDIDNEFATFYTIDLCTV